MPRPKLHRKTISVRIPARIHEQMILLVPELQGKDGHTAYGGVSEYISALVAQDLEHRKDIIRHEREAARVNRQYYKANPE